MASETSDMELSVLPDRSEGGSSINDGQLELMVHRRLLVDDKYGVEEPLNETAFGEGLVVRGSHSVFVGNTYDSAWFRRFRANEIFKKPTFIFVSTSLSLGEWNSNYDLKSAGGLKTDLPDNANILTLATWNHNGDVLLRLEHLYGPNEHPEYSDPVTIDINALFRSLLITDIEEMTLGGNVKLSDVDRLQWTLETRDDKHVKRQFITRDSTNQIELQPLEIRTFLLALENSGESTESPDSSWANRIQINFILMLFLTAIKMYFT